jgi:protein-tyrosine phosphatase
MFHFFSRKTFLIDYLEGFIDIHNHILPGIDDGPKTVEDSIELINAFSQFGVKNFIATPHIMHNYYPNTSETINNSLILLKNELLKSGMKDVSVQASAEHMIDDNFELLLENNNVMPLENNYLLVEMSYLQASINFDEAIIKISSKNYFTLLAHPERYLYLNNKTKQHIDNKNKGILYQLNLLSLGGYYGKAVQKNALQLLGEEMIDFIASDVHNMNQLNSLKELTISQKTIRSLLPIINNTIETFY